MPQDTKIYTRSGDLGLTFCPGAARAGSLKTGSHKAGSADPASKNGRVSKSDPQIEAVGSIDELNTFIGLALSEPGADMTERTLAEVQEDLFKLGAEVAAASESIAAVKEEAEVALTPADAKKDQDTKIKQSQDKTKDAGKIPLRIESSDVKRLERIIDRATHELNPLNNFVIPGGSPRAALLHVSRAVARRAERRCVVIKHILRPTTLAYLNRLSDLLFVLARVENKQRNISEKTWPSPAGQK